MTLGERIKMIIKERHITQIEFAAALGISINYANLLANDKKTTISDTLAKLIEATYGYCAQWVMGGEGEKAVDREISASQADILRRVQKMPEHEARATLAFIIALESVNNDFADDPGNG